MKECTCQTIAVNRLCSMHGDLRVPKAERPTPWPPPPMTVFERFGGISNQGDTVNFYTCRTCYGAVQRQDREGHNDWHNSDSSAPRN